VKRRAEPVPGKRPVCPVSQQEKSGPLALVEAKSQEVGEVGEQTPKKRTRTVKNASTTPPGEGKTKHCDSSSG